MSPAASRIPKRGPPKDWNGFLRERTLALARLVPAIQFRSAQRSRYSSSALAFLTARQVPKSFAVHVRHRVQRCPLPASILLFLRRPSEPGGLRICWRFGERAGGKRRILYLGNREECGR